jgi:V8-like Glu-specific endopeptidase
VKKAPLSPRQTPGNIDEGLVRWPGNLSENKDAFLPLPLPEYALPKNVADFPARLISYNPTTGEHEITPEEAKKLQGLISDWVAGSGPDQGYHSNKTDDVQLAPGNFGALSLITNPESFPWSVNCVVYMTFPDGTNFRAGGVLIDAKHVLTAGHVVHQNAHGGWASSIEVVPGYHNGVDPFGNAMGTTFHSWTGWTISEDFDYDMGVIQLDRPIGALTGWYGYGYNTACSFYQTNTFNNAGYPAASPYTGEDLYYRFGTFDDCPGQQLQINSLSYGGHSGSPAYQIVSPNRFVHATLSNGRSVAPIWTRFVEIGPSRFTNIGNIVANSTPATFDLIPLDVVTVPASIQAGQQLSSLSYLVHNYASVPWSGTVTVRVYLSTNDNISTSDMLLQIHAFTYSFIPKSSVRVNVTSGPTIPVDLCAGTYYIGVILDIPDYDTNNNDSDGQDAFPLNVLCPTIATPTSCAATDVLCDKISVTWNYAGSAQAGFKVYRDGSLVYTGTNPSQRQWDDTVIPGTYNYYVRAYHGCCGDGSNSNSNNGTRLPIPKTPTTVSATDNGCSNIVINWSNMFQEDGYRVYRNGTLIATKGAGVTTHTDTPPFGTYTYCVETFSTCGTSVQTCDNGSRLQTPIAPIPVAASDNSCSNVLITWPNVSNEDGYYVYRDGTLIATKGANVTSHTDAPPPGTYNYCVAAYNSCGPSGQVCNSGTRLTGPVAPTPVAASDNSCSDVLISWANVSGEDGYYVYRDGTLIATKGANVTSHSDAPPAGTYSYCVEAFSSCGSSTQSCNPGTRLSTQSPPASVIATDDRANDVIISWANVSSEDGYRVYRDGTLIATKATNTTQHIDTPPPGTYEYCVEAFNNCGPSVQVCDFGTRVVACLADGDVNADATVTPQDALCAFWTYLYFPGPPPSECINSCYQIASDVNCSGQVTPEDALCIFFYYLHGTCIPEPPCNATPAALVPGPITGTMLMDTPIISVKALKEGDEITVRVSTSKVPSLDAFGFDLEFPTTWLEFQGFERAPATVEFNELEAVVVESGHLRVGGFAVDPVDASDQSDLVVVKFKVLSDDPEASLEVGKFVSDLARAQNVTLHSSDATEDVVTSHQFALYQNRPNPFNPTTVIDFSIDSATDVVLSIYDVSGTLVRTLVDRQLTPGIYAEQWDGRDQNGQAVATGIYLYRLQAGSKIMTRKAVLLK